MRYAKGSRVLIDGGEVGVVEKSVGGGDYVVRSRGRRLAVPATRLRPAATEAAPTAPVTAPADPAEQPTEPAAE